jgi:peptidoglycan/LPS O-acetylase OafA/YrhL
MGKVRELLADADPRAGSIESATYYPWFDWLRAICASVVVLHHNSALRFWSHAGNFPVVVFFALSGWLIGGILLDMKPGQLPRFYFNRAARIWIPYYVALALLLAVSLLRDPITAKWIEIVAYKVTFVYNLFGTRQLADFVQAMPEKGTFSHAWSIHAEEQFYLLAPLLLVIGARHLGRSPVVWGVLAVVVLAFAPLYGAIVLGVLAATVARRYGAWHLTRWGRGALLLLLALGVAGLVLAPAWYDVVAPFPAICIVLLLAVPGPQHPGGVLFGGMSYPLYLNHWIAIYAVQALVKRGVPLPELLRHSLVLALAIALACAMYWWIDRPVLKRRARWFTAARGRLLTTAAYAMVGAGIFIGAVLWN